MKYLTALLVALLLCACSTTVEERLENARRMKSDQPPEKVCSAYRKIFEETGSAEAAFALGELAASGTPDRPADLANAVYYYSAAAAKQHPGALFALAKMFEQGTGVPADRKKALELYCRSAACGNEDARLRASELCFTDPELADAERGIRLLEEGAERGELRCTMRLASFCMGATDAAKRDEAKARRLYEKMADRGVPEAHYFLAVCDYMGIGCPKSRKNGLARMRKAAAAGSPEAWVFLSCLRKDQGNSAAAEKNRAKARALYGTTPFAGVGHVSMWNSFEEMERAVTSAYSLAYPRSR